MGKELKLGRFSDLPKVAELVSGESGIQTWARTGSVNHDIITNRIIMYAKKWYISVYVIERWTSFHPILKESAV